MPVNVVPLKSLVYFTERPLVLIRAYPARLFVVVYSGLFGIPLALAPGPFPQMLALPASWL